MDAAAGCCLPGGTCRNTHVCAKLAAWASGVPTCTKQTLVACNVAVLPRAAHMSWSCLGVCSKERVTEVRDCLRVRIMEVRDRRTELRSGGGGRSET